jgi:hypothetical protein
MRLAHHRADDLGRLDGVVGGGPAHPLHEPQHPPLHRLHAVARVGDSAGVGGDTVLGIARLNGRREFLETNPFFVNSHG